MVQPSAHKSKLAHLAHGPMASISLLSGALRAVHSFLRVPIWQLLASPHHQISHEGHYIPVLDPLSASL